MPKGSSRNRTKDRTPGEKRKVTHAKGEETARARNKQKAHPRTVKKGEETRPLEQAQAIMVRTSGHAMKTMGQQAELMRGETNLIEQQSRKTLMETIDQAQEIVGQAHQVSTNSIQTGANMAQDWLALTWHMWDTAADAMRSIMRSGTAVPHRGKD